MPLLVAAALPAGSLRTRSQPYLDVDGQLALRPWHERDVGPVRAAFECPEIQRWHVRRLDSDEEARAWIAGWATRWDYETDASWAVVGTGSDRPIGQVGLRAISLFDGSAQLSYWVLPAARGSGVAGRAVRTLTRWTFDTLRLHRLSLEHSTRNQASCRVAATAGFDVEGTHRGAGRHADGWHDMHVHARLGSSLAPAGVAGVVVRGGEQRRREDE